MKRLPLTLGILLQALFLALAICAWRTTSTLRVAWSIPGDVSYWNAFLDSHLNMWLAVFWSLFAVTMELPGLYLTRRACGSERSRRPSP